MFKRAAMLLCLSGLCAAPILRATQVQTPTVVIKDLAFSPATLRIKAGQTVTWKNEDDRDHTVLATDGSFSSGNISPGQSFSHPFKATGNFPYACGYHARMHGSIIVE